MPTHPSPPPSPIIILEDVSFSYRDSAKPVFDRLHLEIGRGTSVVVAGPDAAGKTTLGKIVKGLLQPQHGRVIRECDRLREIGYLGGDPYDTLVGVSVEEDVVFGLENLRVEPAEMEVRLVDALRWTGLVGMEKRLTHTLSGGEQQKTALAGMLAMGSRVLMLDEAVTMLDREAKRSIRSLIQSLRSGRDLTVIECTNDLEAVCAAERVIFLDAGVKRFDGTAEEFLSSDEGHAWLKCSGGLWHLGLLLGESGVVRGRERLLRQKMAQILLHINNQCLKTNKLLDNSDTVG